MQATLCVVGALFVPLLFWLGSAAGSLILLRRGVGDTLIILTAALAPCLIWWYVGDPNILLVYVGTLAMAHILRTTQSWTWVLAGSVFVGLVYSWGVDSIVHQVIGQLSTDLPHILSQLRGEMTAAEEQRIQEILPSILRGVMAASLQITSLLCLMLARYWQAALYNPGGFGQEFRALRLPPVLAVLLMVGVLFSPLHEQTAILMPLCSVPLLIAVLALGHGLVAIKRLPGFWLVLLYVGVLLLGNLICLFAVVDSLLDFRGRLAQRHVSNGKG